MGWTSFYTHKSFPEVVTEELEYGGQWKVIARSGRYYVIEKTETGNEHSPNRLAVVALGKKDRDGQVWTKLVDETMGPHESKCPDRLLDMLPEPDNDWAREWRERCRAYNAAKKTQPTLKAGDVVKLTEPIKFQSGGEFDTFEFVSKFTFFAVREGYRGYYRAYRVRLPRDWKTYYKWEKVTA